MWKTNFDAADYGDVLKIQKSDTSVDGTHALVGQCTGIVWSLFFSVPSAA